MALTTILGGLQIPSYHNLRLALGTASSNLTAVGMKITTIIKVPKTGTIIALGFRTASISGTGLSISAGMETVSSGDPTGTAYGGSAVGSATPTSNAFFEVTLATAATATIDNLAALVYTLTAGTTPNVGIQTLTDGSSGNTTVFPYLDTYNGTAWTKSASTLLVSWIKYGDGSYEYMGNPPFLGENYTYNSGSTPDERSLYFKLPPFRSKGFWLYAALGSAATDIILYDTDGTTALRTSTIDTTALSGYTGYIVMPWSSPVTGINNGTYRLSVKPTSTTNITVYGMLTPYAAAFDAWMGGQNFILSTRTDAGTWTQDATKRLNGGLIIDQMDDGIGGGAGGVSRGRLLNSGGF